MLNTLPTAKRKISKFICQLTQGKNCTADKVEFISGFSHINITVPHISDAIEYYTSLLGCRSIRIFEKFKNIGFSKSAGFLKSPEKVEVSIAFLEIPGAEITLEIMQYHSPQTKNMVKKYDVYDVGGVRHIALKVNNMTTAFQHIKSHRDITLINSSSYYQPFQIDNISSEEFRFFDEELESSWEEKEKVCDIVGNIRYFYFVDKYGVQWEFEQGHHDMGT